MRTALFFTTLFLLASLNTNAGTFPPFSSDASCLACNIPDGLAASDLTETSATLSWNAVSGATQYNVEVQDEQNNPSTFHVEATVTGTSYTVTGLQAGVSYKFKVRTRCGGDKSDWSAWVFFTAGGGNNGTCSIPAGLSASVTGATAILTWDAVGGAVKYTIEVEDEQNNPSNFHLEDSTSTNTYTLAGLQTGVSYKFKVRSRCGGGQSDWSAWVFFTAGGGNNGTCSIPAGLSASVTGGTAILTWGTVSGAVKYTIEVEDEQNNPSIFHLEDSTSTNTYTFAGLQTGVSYKFKVRTRCANGQSDWSAWVFFNGTGQGSGSGACTAPVMLSTSMNGTSAKLSWNKVNSAVQYYVEVESEQNALSNFHLEVSVQDSFYTVTGLQAGVLYKFKVSAHCSSGQSDWSNWLFFNGNSSGGNGGGTGSCAMPTGIMTTNITANSAMLIWNVMPGTASYTIEIERNQPGSAPWQITQVVTTNSYLLTGLNPNSRYKFKVRSNCSGGGHSSWTMWRKFKTVATVANASGNADPNDATTNREASPSAHHPAFEVQVWPMPIQASATIRLQNLSVESATLRLFDLSGHLVQERHIQQEGGMWEGTLTFSDLPNGLYLLQTQNGQNTQTSKLVVNH